MAGAAGRREFLARALGALAAAFHGWSSARAQEILPAEASAGGPADPGSACNVAPRGEPGERLVLTGTVYQPDGRTPAVGARLYVYQTDASGIYGPQGSRRPRLRGWIRTGADGRYEIRTIRPGSYPGGRVAAHIHATLGAPDHPERWIDSFLFEGDPYLTGRERARAEGQGRFSPIVSIEKCQDGVWRGTRDLRLER